MYIDRCGYFIAKLIIGIFLSKATSIIAQCSIIRIIAALAAIVGMVLICGIIFSKGYEYLKHRTDMRNEFDGSISHIMDILLNDDEYYYNAASFYTMVDYEANILTMPKVVSATVPWFWEYSGDSMQLLKDNSPRVCLYSPDWILWGHPISEYAPELVEFIDNTYSPLSNIGYSDIYVRNDYFDDAVHMISNDYYEKTHMPMSRSEVEVLDDSEIRISYYPGNKQYKSISFAIWSVENGQDDLQWYEAKMEDNTWISDVYLETSNPKKVYLIHTYTFDDSPQFLFDRKAFF